MSFWDLDMVKMSVVKMSPNPHYIYGLRKLLNFIFYGKIAIPIDIYDERVDELKQRLSLF